METANCEPQSDSRQLIGSTPTKSSSQLIMPPSHEYSSTNTRVAAATEVAYGVSITTRHTVEPRSL